MGTWIQTQIKNTQFPHSITWATSNDHYDIRNPVAVRQQIQNMRPDWIIHLAAQSAVPLSFKNPAETFDINFTGTLNLLKALKEEHFNGTLLLVSSADAYGLVPETELPITENRPLAPRNPYAVSKAACELLCQQWGYSENIKILIARPFNHIGPGQSPKFAISSFAKQISEISLGKRHPHIEVGDIETTRDFTDVRDVVSAYFALLENGIPGEIYNICNGTEIKISEMLNKLIALANIKADIVQNNANLRPAEQRRMIGSNHKLTSATQWKPHFNLDNTLNDILNDWKRKLDQ